MSIDLNSAPEQSGLRGPIPSNSMVLVQLKLHRPNPGRTGSAPELTLAKSGMEYLRCEFAVVAGGFKGRSIWSNYCVAGAISTGQRKAVDISMRHLRAMVEAARTISPKDSSPSAVSARRLNAWTDLHGLRFPVLVGTVLSDPSSRDGRRYINNTIKRIVTPDGREYSALMDGGEIIAEEPPPYLPSHPFMRNRPVEQPQRPSPILQGPRSCTLGEHKLNSPMVPQPSWADG